MKNNILLIILTLFTCTAYSQDTKRMTLQVQDGTNIGEVLSSYSYLFYDYQEAIVSTNKGTGRVNMNYNMLTDEMMYISEKGDTLALANHKDVLSIRFGKVEFVYTSKGYMEILSETENSQFLLVSRRIRLSDIKQYGAYGITNSSAAIDNVSSTAARNRRLTIEREATYKVNVTYYLQKGKSLLQGATEKNFQKIFGVNQKERISNYIKENKLSLKKEEDVIQLFNFCASRD